MTVRTLRPRAGLAALDAGEAELVERTAAFVDEVLLPLEVTAELAGGPLPAADVERIRVAASPS